MCGLALEPVQQVSIRRAQYLIDAMNLIQLARAVKERILGHHLKQHTAIAPDIHLRVIVAISHQTLRRSVPPGRNVLSIRMFRVNPFFT